MLDAYNRGDRITLDSEWQAVSNFEAFTLEFQEQGDRWIESAPAGVARDRRRELASVFTLELAHAALHTPRVWIRLRGILEWGCQHVRSAQQTSFERTWLLAADALFQGAGDMEPAGAHARHSQEQFPDDTRFRLAEALARREARVPANKPGTSTRQLSYGTIPRRDLSVAKVRDTIHALTALTSDPIAGPEARLRLGMVYFHLARLTDSLAELQAASRPSKDPFVTYLALLMAGQVFEASHQPRNAETAYRSALAVFPDAASGLSALAALLFLSDQRDEAVDLYARMVTTHPPAPDPWREYGFGSYRFWPEYIDALRQELRR